MLIMVDFGNFLDTDEEPAGEDIITQAKEPSFLELNPKPTSMIIIIITLKNTHNLFIIIIQIQLQSWSFYSIPNKTQMGNSAWRLQNQFLVVIFYINICILG